MKNFNGYMIIPSPVLHPYAGYYSAIAHELGLKIKRQGELISSVKINNLVKIFLYLYAVVGLFGSHYFYSFWRRLLSEDEFFIWEAIISERIANNLDNLAPRCDYLAVQIAYRTFRAKYAAKRIDLDKIKVVFLMDETYGANFAWMRELAKRHVKLYMLTENKGLIIRKVFPGDRFIGDNEIGDWVRSVSLVHKKNNHFQVGKYWYMYNLPKRVEGYRFDRRSLVVFAHDFCDAAHYTKGNLFRDQLSWLLYIIKIGKRYNVKVFIKWHPNAQPRSRAYECKIQEPLARKGAYFIPREVSFDSLVESPPGAVVTCYGSIICEALIKNVPVIACANHMGDHFHMCYRPPSILELQRLVRDVDSLVVSAGASETAWKILSYRMQGGAAEFPLESPEKFAKKEKEAPIKNASVSRSADNVRFVDYANPEYSSEVLASISEHPMLWKSLISKAFR